MHGGAGLLTELGLVVLALGILARLGNRIGLSPIPLYLLAGLAFGQGGAIPLSITRDFIEVGAEIGVILLLLLLGLEYSAEELISNLRVGFRAGVLDFVCSFTPGVLAGLLLNFGAISSLVLGGVTYVSSSGIVAKMLADFGRLGNRETPVILSILVMEDLAMTLYLPIATGLMVGGGLGAAVVPVGVAVLSAVAILGVALRYGHVVSALIKTPNEEVLLLLVLGLALSVAGLAEGLHISAGVGAFIVGVALSDQVAMGARELLTPLRDLFAAVFFVFFGLQTDPSAIPPVLWQASALAVITGATKVATGWWAARRAGIGRRGRWRAGLALIARGEFSIVLAGIAVSAGAEQKLGPLAATYVLILAVAGPILGRFGGAPMRRTSNA